MPLRGSLIFPFVDAHSRNAIEGLNLSQLNKNRQSSHSFWLPHWLSSKLTVLTTRHHKAYSGVWVYDTLSNEPTPATTDGCLNYTDKSARTEWDAVAAVRSGLQSTLNSHVINFQRLGMGSVAAEFAPRACVCMMEWWSVRNAAVAAFLLRARGRQCQRAVLDFWYFSAADAKRVLSRGFRVWFVYYFFPGFISELG